MRKFLNYLFLVMTCISGLSVIAPLIGHHESVEELSRVVYGTDRPLMGSWIFHYYLQPATGYACMTALLAVVAKEFVVDALNRRLVLNVCGFLAMTALGGLYIAAMNLPAVS